MKIKQKDVKKLENHQKKSDETVKKGNDEKLIPPSIANFFNKKKYYFRENNLHLPKGIFEKFQVWAEANIKRKQFHPDDISWKFFMAFVLSFVRYNQFGKKNWKEVRVHFKLMEHLFGHDICYVMRFLKQEGYLELVRVGSAQARRSNGYLIGEKYHDKSKWEPYTVRKEVRKTRRYISFKKKCFQGLAITEDKVIGNLVNDEKFDPNVKRKVKNDNSNIKERINSPHKNGRMDAAGRFHTVFTNVHKGIRRKMKYDNKTLVEIDIASCQPLLMAALYGDNKKTADGKTLYFEKEKLSKAESLEKEKFIALCQSSKGFYETLGITKAGFGFTMFGHLSGKAWLNLKMVKELKARGFNILVGRLYALRNSLKSYKNDGSVTYGLVARFMQRWESFLMVDTSLCQMTFGAIPVHDAVIVRKEHAEQAMDIITNNLCNYLGIKQTVFKVINYYKKAFKRYVEASNESIDNWNARQDGSAKLIFQN